MNKKRFDEIDVLRAFGLVGVIAIHILTYNLSTPLNKFLWNYLQFFVVTFIFCSGFVLSYIYRNSFNSILKTFFWYKKRLIRLLVPFWIYLAIHYLLWIIFPQFFSGLGLAKNVNYFISSAALFGGTNFNFLPLLFLQLTILFPFFTNWMNKKKILFTYILGASFITLIFTFNVFPYSLYRFVMWIPWSLILIWAIWLRIKEETDANSYQTIKRYLLWGISSFILFLILYIYNLDVSNSLNFYNHKYPPDFYYLFFGIALTSFSLLIAKLKIWQNKFIKPIYFFISNNSYQIFFIHFIILDFVLVLSKKIPAMNYPLLQFMIIFIPSLFMAYILQKALVLKKR